MAKQSAHGNWQLQMKLSDGGWQDIGYATESVHFNYDTTLISDEGWKYANGKKIISDIDMFKKSIVALNTAVVETAEKVESYRTYAEQAILKEIHKLTYEADKETSPVKIEKKLMEIKRLRAELG